MRECNDPENDKENKDDEDDPTLATVFVVPEDPVETVVPGEAEFDLDAWSPSIALMTEAGIISEVTTRSHIALDEWVSSVNTSSIWKR